MSQHHALRVTGGAGTIGQDRQVGGWVERNLRPVCVHARQVAGIPITAEGLATIIDDHDHRGR
jgi:hypothetical protein